MALERRDRAVAHGDKVVAAYAAFGDPVTGTMQPNAPGQNPGNIQPAGVYSTAAYMPKGVNSEAPREPPERLPVERPIAKMCNFPDKPCRAYATPSGYCFFHGQAMRKRGELGP